MIKRYSVLLGVFISVILLLVASMVYPGGSMFDKNSVGFDWMNNFISNLFAEKAINGMDNPSRIWADAGMIFLSASFAIFFVNFSKKIPSKVNATIIKYFGIVSMFFTLLIATPLHDLMVNVASTLSLVSFFYITVYLIRSKLMFFKFFSIIYLVNFYYTMYLYGSGNWNWLPLMQKIILTTSIFLILGLEYFTIAEDFNNIKSIKNRSDIPQDKTR